MTLGEFIKAYRHEHHESQRDFAKRGGFSNTYISFLERGWNPQTDEPIKPSLEALQKLSRAMGLTFDELISSVDDFVVDLSAHPRYQLDLQHFGAPPADEQEILDAFRELSDDGKAYIRQQLDIAKKLYKK